MSEWLEVVKVTGPAIAVLFYFAIQFWRKLKEKDQKIDELYKMLAHRSSDSSLHFPSSSYFEFLSKKADELKSDIDKIKSKSKDDK